MFQDAITHEGGISKFNQESSQVELDMKELYKWLERPITEEDEEYQDEESSIS
jgi:hypothetical protein